MIRALQFGKYSVISEQSPQVDETYANTVYDREQ